MNGPEPSPTMPMCDDCRLVPATGHSVWDRQHGYINLCTDCWKWS